MSKLLNIEINTMVNVATIEISKHCDAEDISVSFDSLVDVFVVAKDIMNDTLKQYPRLATTVIKWSVI